MDADCRQNVEDLVKDIVGAAYEVSNNLGAGFLEKVYERALLTELRSRNLEVRTQVPFQIRYKDELVGEYVADMTVADKVIVELKCVTGFSNLHIAQCINYLKAIRNAYRITIELSVCPDGMEENCLWPLNYLRVFAFIRG